MDGLTLLIIDSSDEFRNAMEAQLRSDYLIFHARDGLEAYDTACQLHPDAILLDLMLTGVDGITLLHKLHDANVRPVIMALTRLYNEYVEECVTELGIGYVMLKPCDPVAIARHLKDLTRRLQQKSTENTDPHAQIARILNKLTFSPRHRGYDYLLTAVQLMLDNPSISITKELYPKIGSIYGSTPAQVERSIRTAISAACSQGTAQHWEELFPPDTNGLSARPSNGFFIARLVDELRCKNHHPA